MKSEQRRRIRTTPLTRVCMCYCTRHRISINSCVGGTTGRMKI